MVNAATGSVEGAAQLAAPKLLSTRALIACAAGVALALSCPPAETLGVLAPIPALFFAPLLLWAAHGERRAMRLFLLGGVAGFVFSTLSMGWALEALRRLAGDSAHVLLLGLCLLQALPSGVALGAMSLVPERHRWWSLALSIATAFTLVPALFPWRPSHMLLPWLPMVQLAELGGQPLLDLLLCALGCRAWVALKEQTGRDRWRGLVVVAATCTLMLAAGLAMLSSLREHRRAGDLTRVGIVQPDVTLAEAAVDSIRPRRLAALQEATESLQRQGTSLVVWPESAYPYPFERDATTGGVGPSRAQGGLGPGLLLLGVMMHGEGCNVWNSMVALDGRGRVVGRADKRRPFPFVEYVPLHGWLPWLQDAYPCPGIRTGTDAGVIELAGLRAGVLNCFEDVTDDYARRLASNGAEFLVASSNDAWFDDARQARLHRTVSRFRAIETRRDIVRASNRGESTLTVATGEDLASLPFGSVGTLRVEVLPHRRLTLFTRWPHVIPATGLLMGFVFLWRGLHRRGA